ncbi:MAG: glycosyltransferase family 2 protein [Chitinispirillales bacterium]|jgi:GT2 family glycosyltransferase|nr:glycosyltransferase family 2 protein [Chitinispirillales bacterium]
MPANNAKDILISIVIVNYKVPYCLVEALHSLRLAKLYDRCEVIIVDNASGDNSRELVASRFQEVTWIGLKANIGFGKACNIGAEAARGEYLLLLNPDTVISSNTLADAVEFMEAHPGAGLMGPKILNPDGTLQLSCRRSIPTPSVAFYYFAGLSYLFPKSRRFGRYHLTYMDEDEPAQVDVISGSFMFMRRGLFSEIGGFDKRFFMYGEDIDLCYRISRAGHEVWYYPKIKIVHQKGKSSSKRKIRSRFYFYEAMIIFFRKYRGQQEMFFPWWLIWLAIVFQGALNIGTIVVRSIVAILIDIAAVNAAAWAALSPLHRCLYGQTAYAGEPLLPLIGMHALLSFAFVAMFVYNGVYSERRYSAQNAFFSGLLSGALYLSGVYFLTPYGIAGFGAAAGFSALMALLWRETLPLAAKGLRGRIFAPESALVVGQDEDVVRYLRGRGGKRGGPRIVGVVRLGPSDGGERAGGGGQGLSGRQIEGYPILGDIRDLKLTLAGCKADVLLIAAARPWYSEIINMLVEYRNMGVGIRWEAME